MEINTTDLSETAEFFFNIEKFDEIIELLTDEVLEKERGKERDKAAELYVRRGTAWYEKKTYDKAINDYNKAIEINPNSAVAFYNRGLLRAIKKEYPKAREDFDKAIEICPDDAAYYVSRGSILRFLKEYHLAIGDYSKAINLDHNYQSAYYNRGLAKKESNVDLKGAKQDLERYLKLAAANKDDPWSKYAIYYIASICERTKDKKLSEIIDVIDRIKDILRIIEDCVTHYTSLSVVKSLIGDLDNKFRISEGNFMNDPTEGQAFFGFLEYKSSPCQGGSSSSESFSAKPFIGSFVAKDKQDDLNMWRFYGKEDGAEAKGCAITLGTQEFIDDINEALSKREENYPWNDSDINFYKVVYLETKAGNFYIPGSSTNDEEELKGLMTDLKKKVMAYTGKNKAPFEAHLNRIAFLFKSDAYKNENEVRMVVKGVGFTKEYNRTVIPPRVYIELESIKTVTKQITLGPKVDKVNE